GDVGVGRVDGEVVPRAGAGGRARVPGDAVVGGDEDGAAGAHVDRRSAVGADAQRLDAGAAGYGVAELGPVGAAVGRDVNDVGAQEPAVGRTGVDGDRWVELGARGVDNAAGDRRPVQAAVSALAHEIGGAEAANRRDAVEDVGVERVVGDLAA